MGDLPREYTCLRCGARMKRWDELSADEKLLAERMPASAEFTKHEREKHRFCTRCWFESPPTGPVLA